MDNKCHKEAEIVRNRGSLQQTMKVLESRLSDMRATVLVPTRLNDIDSETIVKNGVNNIHKDNENLFNVYNDLQRMSKLLYGDKNQPITQYTKNDSRYDMNGNTVCKNSTDCLNDDNLLAKLEFHVQHMKVILNELCGTAAYITNVYKEDVQNMHMNYNHIEYNNSEIKHYYTSNSSNDTII